GGVRASDHMGNRGTTPPKSGSDADFGPAADRSFPAPMVDLTREAEEADDGIFRTPRLGRAGPHPLAGTDDDPFAPPHIQHAAPMLDPQQAPHDEDILVEAGAAPSSGSAQPPAHRRQWTWTCASLGRTGNR